MFATPAYAQTAGAAAGGGGSPMDLLLQMAPLALLFIMFYFLLIRPQQKRANDLRAQVAACKRGDSVVLSSGVIGTVIRTDEKEAVVEIAPKVEVKVVKAMIAEVRPKGAPAAANDAKA